jgi:hypothetical protein
MEMIAWKFPERNPINFYERWISLFGQKTLEMFHKLGYSNLVNSTKEDLVLIRYVMVA